MAENERKIQTGHLGEWLILILVIVCMLLIVIEVAANVLAELEARSQQAPAGPPVPAESGGSSDLPRALCKVLML